MVILLIVALDKFSSEYIEVQYLVIDRQVKLLFCFIIIRLWVNVVLDLLL